MPPNTGAQFIHVEKGPVMEPLRGPFLGIEERGKLERGGEGAATGIQEIASRISPRRISMPPPPPPDLHTRRLSP